MAEPVWPLDEAAQNWPGAPALVSGSQVLSYDDYDRVVAATVARIRDNGLRAGDRLGILLQPSPDYVILLMACFRAGVVACPLNTRLPAKALESAMRHLGCEAIVRDECGRISPPLKGVAPRGAGGCSPLLSVASLTAVARNAPEAHKRRGLPVLRRGCLSLVPLPLDNQPATILLTSGSSGTPKGVVHTLDNHIASARASNRNIPVEPGDCWLLSLPLYHVAGIGVVFRCLLGGGTVAVPEADEDLLSALRRYEVTHISLVATQLQRLLKEAGGIEVFQGLKAILLGGSAVPASLVQEACEQGLNIATSYGSTETASQIAATRPGGTMETLLTCGRPLTPDTIRIAPDGEIQVRGKTLFSGYADGAEIMEIIRPLTADGWFSTGDLGHVDERGRLHVIGRKDNLFISGGENIQPEEIEAALCRVPGVVQAVVAPIADEEYGFRPVAFVRIDAPGSLEADALSRALRERLPGYKIPVAYHAWPEGTDPGESRGKGDETGLSLSVKVDRAYFAALARQLKH